MSLPPSSAPTATGWSDSCRAGFAPAEGWRLSRRTLSVVYQQVEPLTTVVRESAASAGQEFEVAWRGADGLLDQMPDPEPIDGSPTRAAVDWHEVAKRASDFYDDERSMPALADRKVLRRRGRVTVRRGFLRPPMSAEAVARMVELRAQGLGFKRIARAVGCAPITVSRYLRSFEEEGP